MRLDNKQIKNIRWNIDTVLKPLNRPPNLSDAKNLIDTIEALQQENEQLKEQINTAKIGWDTYKTYSEQLEQQTADLIAEKEELARRLIKKDNRIKQLEKCLRNAKVEIYPSACLCVGGTVCSRCEQIAEIDKLLGGIYE